MTDAKLENCKYIYFFTIGGYLRIKKGILGIVFFQVAVFFQKVSTTVKLKWANFQVPTRFGAKLGFILPPIKPMYWQYNLHWPMFHRHIPEEGISSFRRPTLNS